MIRGSNRMLAESIRAPRTTLRIFGVAMGRFPRVVSRDAISFASYRARLQAR